MKKKGALPMVGGEGQYSYSHNSTYQRSSFLSVENKVHEAILEKFDVPITGTIRIADLGCSVGPNTFYAMQTIVDAILLKQKESLVSHDECREEQEIQVFFCDQVGNDFNLLFNSLPSDQSYWVAGGPGSFYSRLFPRASIHCFNSSIALHWLSEAPDGIDNKGRIHCYGGGADVLNAYIRQFRSDLMAFLSARAEELLTGGLLILQLGCRPHSMAPDAPRYDLLFGYLEPILRELVDEGKVKEGELDSFQVPLFLPTIEEFKEVVEMNGCFTVHVGEHVNQGCGLKGEGDEGTEADLQLLAHSVSGAARAILEKLVTDYFGSDIVEELFRRLPSTVYQHFTSLPSPPALLPTIFFVLQREPRSSDL